MGNLSNFIKFGCVGLANTVISLAIYYLLNAVGVNYIIAMTTGYLISAVCGYFLNKFYVFKKKNNKSDNTATKYILLYGSALLINSLLMWLFVSKLNISDKIAPILTVCITTLYNYLFSRYWVFKWQAPKSQNGYLPLIKKDIILITLSLATIVLLGFLFINNMYNHPVADDYSNYNALMGFLPNGKNSNTPELFKGFFDRANNIYVTWQGTYFANILFSINPLLISTDAYRVVVLAFQVFWVFSIIYFATSFFGNDKQKNLNIFKLSLVFVLFSLSFIYSIAEGFYWLTSDILYIFPFSLSLVFFGFQIHYFRNEKLRYFIACIIFAILLAGTSYVTGLLVGLVLLVETVTCLARKNKKLFYKTLVLLTVFCIGFCFNVFCPGNFTRIGNYSDHEMISIFKVGVISLYNATTMMLYLLTETAFVPIVICFLPILHAFTKKSSFRFLKPVPTIVVTAFGFIALFAPCAYSYNSYYQETRVENIQLLYLFLMIIFNLINYLGYSKKNLPLQKSNYYLIGFSALITILASIGMQNLSSKKIVDDVLLGPSRNYNSCMESLYEEMGSTVDEPVVISNCTEYPYSLHHYVITDDGWQTGAMEKYFNKEIMVKE